MPAVHLCFTHKDFRIAYGACCGVPHPTPTIKHRPACYFHMAASNPWQLGVPQTPSEQNLLEELAAPARRARALMVLCLCSPSPSPPAMVPTLAPTPGSQGASQPVSTFRAVAPAQPGVCTVQYLQVSHCNAQQHKTCTCLALPSSRLREAGAMHSSSTVLAIVASMPRYGVVMTAALALQMTAP